MVATDSRQTFKCRICGDAGAHRHFTAREMQFGSREEFQYFECGACGTIQIAEIPADLGRHYANGYYSFSNVVPEKYSWWRGALKRARARYALEGKGLLGAWLSGHWAHWDYFDWFRAAGVHTGSSILDVGCGRGDHLLRFASDGFRSLTGIDPFVESDVTFDNGVRIYRRSLNEMTGAYDCLYASHSLEHTPDAVAACRDMHKLTRDGGVAVIAIPVSGTWACREYGVHWRGLDAPRHIAIPSIKAMNILADKSGFTLEKVMTISGPAQLAESEAYKRGVSQTKLYADGLEAHFTTAEIRSFQVKSDELKRANDGDCACFILRKGGNRNE